MKKVVLKFLEYMIVGVVTILIGVLFGAFIRFICTSEPISALICIVAVIMIIAYSLDEGE